MKDHQYYIDLAHERLVCAYAPYSNFSVSAVLVMKDGVEFTGVNIENVSFGATVCAERVAIFSAVNAGYRNDDFAAIYISGRTKEYITPCSLCRQVFVEFFAPKMQVYLSNDAKEYKSFSVEELVPHSFTSMDM